MNRDNRKACSQIIFRSLILLLLLVSFSSGQTSESENSPEVIVPEPVMEQVVRRVLIWSFKSVNKPKVIYLAKQGIKQSWLPLIKNIEFRLLSDEEIEQQELKVYFFTKPELTKNTYDIGFAFGEPHCEYFGHNWHFRLSKQKVTLWDGGSVGGGCGSAS